MFKSPINLMNGIDAGVLLPMEELEFTRARVSEDLQVCRLHR